MAIELSPRIQARIAKLVEHSDYPDANALIDDALAALSRQRQIEDLTAELQTGIDQADRGELIPFTDELWEEMRESARRRYAAGERANDAGLKRLIDEGVDAVQQRRVREFTPELRETLWQQALDEARPPATRERRGAA